MVMTMMMMMMMMMSRRSAILRKLTDYYVLERNCIAAAERPLKRTLYLTKKTWFKNSKYRPNYSDLISL